MSPPETPHIREASIADVAELTRLRWEFRVEEQSAQTQAAFTRECEAWLREAIRSGRWFMSVSASETGRLSGCMYVQQIEKVPSPGAGQRAWGYATNCYVSVEHRGMGTGRRLLDLLIDVARRRRLEFLIVWPGERAVSFFRRAGFRAAADVHAGPDDEPPLELVL